MVTFVVRCEDGTRTEFGVPLEDLQEKPETMLSVASKPCWNTANDKKPIEIGATQALEESWTPAMARAICRWYASRGDAMELPVGVELAEFVAVADALLLDLGDLSETITFPSDDEEGAFPQRLRAQFYIKSRKNVKLAVAYAKYVMNFRGLESMTFIALRQSDNIDYINASSGTDHRLLGSKT